MINIDDETFEIFHESSALASVRRARRTENIQKYEKFHTFVKSCSLGCV